MIGIAKRKALIIIQRAFVTLFLAFAFLFPTESAVADETYHCWNCGSTFSRSQSKNCSQCGWDICDSCGACSYDCPRSAAMARQDDLNDTGTDLFTVGSAGGLLLLIFLSEKFSRKKRNAAANSKRDRNLN